MCHFSGNFFQLADRWFRTLKGGELFTINDGSSSHRFAWHHLQKKSR